MHAWSACVTSIRGWARELSTRAILAYGYALFLLYAFPGYMSSDSVLQIGEGRTHVLSDGHPPIMAAEWGVLDAIVSGPILMLLLQSMLFLGGVYGLLRRIVSPRVAAVVACALLLLPPILTPMAVIWKDSQMAGYLLAGTAAMLSERRRIKLIGLGLITIGCAMRFNAFGAAVPLVGFLFEWRPGLRWWKRYALSGAVSVAVVVAAFSINRALTVEHRRWTPAFADIVGVLNYTHDRSDDDLAYVLRGTRLRVATGIQARARALYSPRNSWQVTRGEDRMFDDPVTSEDWAALTRSWKEIISSDWHAYFTFRLASFAEVLGLSDDGTMAPVWNLFLEDPSQRNWIEHDASWSSFQEVAGSWLGWLSRETPMFRPWFYALISIVVLLTMSRDRLSFALLTSGVLYELSFAPAAGTPDFRYSHWMIVCTYLATTIVFIQRLRSKR
ncbi:MAG: hypothetical protein JWO36_3859 [Myxococcales bacterium]|nr:hypothetical protein [Myxococcales bacterium]